MNMEQYYVMVIDAMAECIKDASRKENALKEAQDKLEAAFDRMAIAGQPTDQLARLIEQIKTLRFDHE